MKLRCWNPDLLSGMRFTHMSSIADIISRLWECQLMWWFVLMHKQKNDPSSTQTHEVPV